MIKMFLSVMQVDAPVRQTISSRGQLTTLFAGEDLRHSEILG